MRTQLRRKSENRRPRLRGHVAPDCPEPAEPEQRVREAGGPEDTETHACGCGYVFEAPVSTSVACPHCGSGQAW
jgi:hypothetical protein